MLDEARFQLRANDASLLRHAAADLTVHGRHARIPETIRALLAYCLQTRGLVLQDPLQWYSSPPLLAVSAPNLTLYVSVEDDHVLVLSWEEEEEEDGLSPPNKRVRSALG